MGLRNFYPVNGPSAAAAAAHAPMSSTELGARIHAHLSMAVSHVTGRDFDAIFHDSLDIDQDTNLLVERAFNNNRREILDVDHQDLINCLTAYFAQDNAEDVSLDAVAAAVRNLIPNVPAVDEGYILVKANIIARYLRVLYRPAPQPAEQPAAARPSSPASSAHSGPVYGRYDSGEDSPPASPRAVEAPPQPPVDERAAAAAPIPSAIVASLEYADNLSSPPASPRAAAPALQPLVEEPAELPLFARTLVPSIASIAYCQITDEDFPRILTESMCHGTPPSDRYDIQLHLTANFAAITRVNCESAVPAIRAYLELDSAALPSAAQAIRNLVPDIEPHSEIEEMLLSRARFALEHLWRLYQASPRPS
jgi:hypothetical protein